MKIVLNGVKKKPLSSFTLNCWY